MNIMLLTIVYTRSQARFEIWVSTDISVREFYREYFYINIIKQKIYKIHKNTLKKFKTFFFS